jgi:hypothetical protein
VILDSFAKDSCAFFDWPRTSVLADASLRQYYAFVMISGIHALIYAKNTDKARAFFHDVLEFKSVDAGHGWLIFALPPAELGIHPAEKGKDPSHELYLMCDDLKATLAKLKKKGVKCGAVKDAGWGVLSSVNVPGAGKIALYQPRHPTALG